MLLYFLAYLVIVASLLGAEENTIDMIVAQQTFALGLVRLLLGSDSSLLFEST